MIQGVAAKWSFSSLCWNQRRFSSSSMDKFNIMMQRYVFSQYFPNQFIFYITRYLDNQHPV